MAAAAPVEAVGAVLEAETVGSALTIAVLLGTAMPPLVKLDAAVVLVSRVLTVVLVEVEVVDTAVTVELWVVAGAELLVEPEPELVADREIEPEPDAEEPEPVLPTTLKGSVYWTCLVVRSVRRMP